MGSHQHWAAIKDATTFQADILDLLDILKLF